MKKKRISFMRVWTILTEKKREKEKKKRRTNERQVVYRIFSSIHFSVYILLFASGAKHYNARRFTDFFCSTVHCSVRCIVCYLDLIIIMDRSLKVFFTFLKILLFIFICSCYGLYQFMRAIFCSRRHSLWPSNRVKNTQKLNVLFSK